jgi:integrase
MTTKQRGKHERQRELKSAPLVFDRSGELRGAEFAALDLDNSQWRIQRARMKMREQHIVPVAAGCCYLA